MIETPRIVHTRPVRMASIRLTVPRSEIRNVMHPGLVELRAAVAAQGVAVSGPWFTHHLRLPDDAFDFEICVPVASEITPVGRVQPGELPAATVAQTLHHGPYEGLPGAWGELGRWIVTGGHTSAPELWERYVVGPESSSDPLDWRTELSRPLTHVAPSR